MLLAIVAQGPGDGYAIASSLSDQTRLRVAVSPRVVFTSLHRLTRNRLLHRRGGEYLLTQAGARSMAAKRREWDTLHHAMQSILDNTDPEGPRGG